MPAKKLKKKTAEEINRNRSKWYLTHSKKLATEFAGRKTIYQLPNRVYAVRKPRR